MKRLEKFLNTIRSWPEEGKTALAFFVLAAATLAIYSLWNSYLSSELSRNPRENQTSAAPAAPDKREAGVISLLGNTARDLAQTFKKIWRR